MNLVCKHFTITQNDDSTFKVELNGVKFKDTNGEELEGKLIFSRLSQQGVDSFINENVIPHSEIFAMIIPNKGENDDIRTDKTEDRIR